MKIKALATCFRTLGHVRRLEIIRFMIQSAPDRLTTGTIGNQTKIPASTLTHHLSLLEQAGLITREQEGQTIYCSVNVELINQLAGFLIDECCIKTKKTC